MTLSTRLELHTTQTLVMTPKLQQAIRLLQMTNLEVSEFIKTEIENNPFLCENESVELKTTEIKDTNRFIEKHHDDEFDDLFSLENFIKSPESLKDHLELQLNATFTDDLSLKIGKSLIHSLDEHGYLEKEINSIANEIGATNDQINEVILKLQHFGPAGIFSRNLKECLTIQLKERNQFDDVAEKLISNLELLGKGELTKLQKVCEVNLNELAKKISEIRKLTPYPISGFEEFTIQSRIPDVFVKPIQKGEWLVELNSEVLPKILIDKTYYETVSEQIKNKTEKEFINEKMSNANWLLRVLDQRATTILRVAKEIVYQQSDFFSNGPKCLKPLTLKDISRELNLHESTVSRVTTNKSILTPYGLFDLKYFFSSTLPGEHISFSGESVKYMIRNLIESEPNNLPHSDDYLVFLLSKEGVSIARRTVAKYRDNLKIPPSSQRKRLKALSFVDSKFR